uniref:C-type lectin domain-containing protein n=1 Tax=Bubo bubo TaxID=30461 RepID=A0A8C0IH56_BUBBB
WHESHHTKKSAGTRELLFLSFSHRCLCVFLLNGVALSMTAQAFQPRPQPCSRCPFDWIGYRGKCYYFLEAEGNWTSSRDNCSALAFFSPLFQSFVTRYKGSLEHWIGLSREDEEQPWEWVNGSRLSPLFQIRGGGGLCALVKDDGLSSSRCGAEKSWVCNKPELQSPRKGNGTRRAQNLCVSS